MEAYYRLYPRFSVSLQHAPFSIPAISVYYWLNGLTSRRTPEVPPLPPYLLTVDLTSLAEIGVYSATAQLLTCCAAHRNCTAAPTIVGEILTALRILSFFWRKGQTTRKALTRLPTPTIHPLSPYFSNTPAPHYLYAYRNFHLLKTKLLSLLCFLHFLMFWK